MQTKFPDDRNATAFLRSNWTKALSNCSGPVVDIASGFGRNARFLARRGIQTYCLDNNRDAMATIGNLAVHDANLIPMQFDLSNEALPFSKGQLGGALCIHSWRYSWCRNLIRILAPLIRQGGFIHIETVGNRGGNYLELPKAGLLRMELEEYFAIQTYIERKAGPNGCDAVSVKALASRR